MEPLRSVAVTAISTMSRRCTGQIHQRTTAHAKHIHRGAPDDADWSRRTRLASPVRVMRTGFQKIAQVLSDALLRQMPQTTQQSNRKLVVFSDSRQDAAKLSAGMRFAHYRDALRQSWPGLYGLRDVAHWPSGTSFPAKHSTVNGNNFRQSSQQHILQKPKFCSVRRMLLLPICPRREPDNSPTPKHRNKSSTRGRTRAISSSSTHCGHRSTVARAWDESRRLRAGRAMDRRRDSAAVLGANFSSGTCGPTCTTPESLSGATEPPSPD